MFSGIKIYSTNTCLVSVYQLIFFPFVLFVGWGFGVAKLIWNCNVCFENLHNNSKKGNISDGFFSISPKTFDKLELDSWIFLTYQTFASAGWGNEGLKQFFYQNNFKICFLLHFVSKSTQKDFPFLNFLQISTCRQHAPHLQPHKTLWLLNRSFNRYKQNISFPPCLHVVFNTPQSLLSTFT